MFCRGLLVFLSLTSAISVAAAGNSKASSGNQSTLVDFSAGYKYITQCSYNLLAKGTFTWPGQEDVCNSGTQNSCIQVPNLIIDFCKHGERFLGSQYSYKIRVNDTYFWTEIYKDASRDKHCQEGTEVETLTSRMKMYPRGPLNTCLPKYPGDGKLNKDWESPSNFCSTHRDEVWDIKDAHDCVASAWSTSAGLTSCRNADTRGKSIPSICGATEWAQEPACGCFWGEMYYA